MMDCSKESDSWAERQSPSKKRRLLFKAGLYCAGLAGLLHVIAYHHSFFRAGSRYQRKLLKYTPVLPVHDPRTTILKDHHPFDPTFRSVSDRIRDELTPQERTTIHTFVSNLRSIHCMHDEHSFQSLNGFLLRNMTNPERVKWMNPSRGSLRSLNMESAVPCNQEYWVEEGEWYSIPMYAHCCNKGTAVAKCTSPVIMTPSQCTPSSSLGGQHPSCESDATLLCLDYLTNTNKWDDCLAYTFGIADQWDFEDYIGIDHNCDVHAHDPTTRYKAQHKAHDAKNVAFHYQGLGVKGGTATKRHFQGYGSLGGEMMSLGDLWRHHGHVGRPITLAKLDCEGCEFEAFHQLATTEPEVISQVCTIVVELHFSTTLQMDSSTQLKLMASFWQHYIVEFGFRLWYIHANPGAHYDQLVNPYLLDVGLDPTVCCYEIGLRRKDC